MAIDIVVPRLGWSMDEGTFVEWLKEDGQWVDAGEMLFVLEGDKVTQEIESFDSGFLRISPAAPQAGDTVAVGQVLGYLVGEGEVAPCEAGQHHAAQPACGHTEQPGQSTPQTLDNAARQHVQDQAFERTKASPTIRPGTSARPRADRVPITPRARRAARQQKIDWTKVKGTGRNGRIRERDIR